MKPLSPAECQTLAVNTGRTDATLPVQAIVEAWKSLRDEPNTHTEDEEKTFFELSLRLARSDYFGLADEAMAQYSILVSGRGIDYFRPPATQDDEDPIPVE